MSRPHPILAGSIAIGAAVALLTGCSPSSPGASVSSARAQENVSQACAAASAFAGALTNFKQTLKPGVTVGQVDSARDQVAKTYDDLIKASQDVAKDEVEAVKTAKNKFEQAVKAVPDDATLSQAVSSLRDEAANVQAAVSDLQTSAKC
ncbi:ElaB/YqjD/DUF883 family membrane-anchored ribosome-binding protein [Arthrobacter ginsengisoli]|uniref:ElaB/YqjD/DUF883 family membrane-anchored ribosome-binding protein n=1 Tax=Arthrobacter ginsengisoli TaxID=1356565 RepID=A0ABU1UGU2_9MICC|nr:hypothetical protein [Arthrobacter ginsengisoli]MDR7084408.1 ElaB/YqjD/DUF883 family membrane-anchored ribosome-binding protein [Arthrobacter ginsengisoli]